MDYHNGQVNKLTINLVLVFLSSLMMTIIFVIDLNTPLGIAIGTGYTIVILYSWLLPGTLMPVYTALVCTFLVIVGFFYSPKPIEELHFWGINRLISMVIIWLTAALVSIAKRSFEELEKARDNLENKVLERTADLRTSEERIRLMVEDIKSYSILLIDSKGIIENWNIGATQIKGYQAEEIIGESFKKFYSSEAIADRQPEKLLEIARQEGRVQEEGWRIRKDGTKFWANVTLTALYNEDGEILGFSKVTRDLTEQRQSTEIQKAHAVLEAKNEELGQFTYIASHDLQEPLITVKGYVQILEEDYAEELGEEGQFYLETIANSTNRMSNLVKDLLDYSRIGKNKKHEIVRTNEIIQEVLEDLKGTINEKKAIITIEKSPEIVGYSTEYRQLFQNLISNAIKFHKKGERPKISITAFRKDDFWEFAISDNGIGIDTEQQQKIFMIFKRLYSKNTYEGTGIGLATCQKIVELHGGKIWVESEKGVGSTFYFTIPV